MAKKLVRADQGGRRQNLEKEGVARKIFRNKELPRQVAVWLAELAGLEFARMQTVCDFWISQ